MRCDHCSCPPGPTCPGGRNPAICRQVDPTSPKFRPGVRRNLANYKEPTHAAQTSDAPPALTVAESTALIAAMKGCPNWRASSCGCGLNRCLGGKGKAGEVSYADCFACLRPSARADRGGIDVGDVGRDEGGVDVDGGAAGLVQ